VNEFAKKHIRQARSQGIQVGVAVSLYGISFGALSGLSFKDFLSISS
jgi:hypothetical protein